MEFKVNNSIFNLRVFKTYILKAAGSIGYLQMFFVGFSLIKFL